MTFSVAGIWLAVRLGQMDRVAVAEKLWGVPLTWPNHLGLFDDGQDLIPVLQLAASHHATGNLMAILTVRGQRVAVAIDQPGRLYETYEMHDKTSTTPSALSGLPLTPGNTADTDFWLLDADLLWKNESASVAG